MLGNFDVVVIAGCNFGPSCVFHGYKRYHFSGLKARRQQLLTREMFMRATMRTMNESVALILARVIRVATDAPICLVPKPLPAENGYLDRENASMKHYQVAKIAGDGETLMSLYSEVTDRLATRGYMVLAQHDSTKASAISTLQRYSDNSIRLRADVVERHPESDYFHMNESYGVVMSDVVIDAVKSLIRGQDKRPGLWYEQGPAPKGADSL